MSSPEWLDMSAYSDVDPDEVASQAELGRLHAAFHEPAGDQLPPDAWEAMLHGIGDAHEAAGLPVDGSWADDATGAGSWDQHADGVPADHDAVSHHDEPGPQDLVDHDDGFFHGDDAHHDGFHDDGHHDDLG